MQTVGYALGIQEASGYSKVTIFFVLMRSIKYSSNIRGTNEISTINLCRIRIVYVLLFEILPKYI